MMRAPASGLSRKTCSKTQRKAGREQCSRESSSARSRLGRRQTSLSWTPNGPTSCRRGASCPRGSTMVNHPTSRPAWSTASSSCGIVRSSRWTKTASSPKPTRLGGGFGDRCRQPALLRCRADRASADNRADLLVRRSIRQRSCATSRKKCPNRMTNERTEDQRDKQEKCRKRTLAGIFERKDAKHRSPGNDRNCTGRTGAPRLVPPGQHTQRPRQDQAH